MIISIWFLVVFTHLNVSFASLENSVISVTKKDFPRNSSNCFRREKSLFFNKYDIWYGFCCYLARPISKVHRFRPRSAIWAALQYLMNADTATAGCTWEEILYYRAWEDILIRIVELKSENSKCPVVKYKITGDILTNYRLKITVNWLQQKYLHVSPIMLEWGSLQRPNIETEYKRSCDN